MSPAVSSTEVLQSPVAVLQSSAGADGVHGADEARAALPNLAMKPDGCLSILQMPATGSSLPGLLAVLREGSDHAKQMVAGALAKLAAMDEVSASAIAKSPGVLETLALLLSEGSEACKEKATAALHHLSCAAGSSSLVGQTDGVIPGLVLQLHSGNPEAIHSAISALHNLAAIVEFRIEIASAPHALTGICNVLWGRSRKAQEGAATTVRNLAEDNEIRSVVGCTDGMIEGLVALLVTGTDRSKSDATAALCNLASNTELRSCILRNPRVLYGLRCMLTEGPERHASEAVLCLQKLSVTAIDHKERIAATDGMLLGLVTLLLHCKPASQTQENASRTLLNLVTGSPGNKTMAASVNGVLQALQRCLENGSCQAKEHAAAVLHEFALGNDDNNPFAVLDFSGLVQALSGIVNDVTATEKASEYAASCLLHLVRTRECALVVAQNQDAVEGLILMSKFDHPGRRAGSGIASMSALRILVQFPESAGVLFQKDAVECCFLSVLRERSSLEHDESGLRILVEASVGMAFLGCLDTRNLDRVPQAAVEFLICALAARTRGEGDMGLGCPRIQLLFALNVVAARDENKLQLLQGGIVKTLIDILQNQNFGAEVVTNIEIIKLCWHLAMLPSGRRELLTHMLPADIQRCTHFDRDSQSECEKWMLGLHWQLGLMESQTDVHSWYRARASVPLADRSILVVADQADERLRNVVTENLTQGGYKIWPTDANPEFPLRMTDFVAAANTARLVIMIVSSSFELSPCCRAQALHVKNFGLPYLCLNVFGADELCNGMTSISSQSGYLQSELGLSIKCTPSMFDDREGSALNGIVQEFLSSGATCWTAAMRRSAGFKDDRPVDRQSYTHPPYALTSVGSGPDAERRHEAKSNCPATPESATSLNVATVRGAQVYMAQQKQVPSDFSVFGTSKQLADIGDRPPQEGVHVLIWKQKCLIQRQQQQIDMLKQELKAMTPEERKMPTEIETFDLELGRFVSPLEALYAPEKSSLLRGKGQGALSPVLVGTPNSFVA